MSPYDTFSQTFTSQEYGYKEDITYADQYCTVQKQTTGTNYFLLVQHCQKSLRATPFLSFLAGVDSPTRVVDLQPNKGTLKEHSFGKLKRGLAYEGQNRDLVQISNILFALCSLHLVISDVDLISILLRNTEMSIHLCRLFFLSPKCSLQNKPNFTSQNFFCTLAALTFCVA